MRFTHVLLLVAAAGCATTRGSELVTQLSPNATNVLELGPGPVPESCQRVDDLNARQDCGVVFCSEESRRMGARNAIMNQAAERGATHVVFRSEVQQINSAITVSATALRCGHVPTAAAPIEPVQAGCGKDTDCKGERVCNAGVCSGPT